ncbi:MAG: hypothetical protein Q8Q73_14080, partial [Stagnimonas sp.]|nr:hypothetical protein [Stagnimonas sp.]
GGAVEITGDDSQGDGVVVGVDSVSISGDSITSSGNIFVTGDGDVSMSLYAGAGSIDVTGALGVYSDYGGADLDVDAYFGYEDPDEDGIFTVVNGTGNVNVGSVTVRATTNGGSSPDPLYGSVLYAPPLSVASLDADGDLIAGDVNVGSYQALAYELVEQGYGGPVTGHLNAAATRLLINQEYHSSAGSVQLTSAQVSGYGESTVAISATDFVRIDNGLVVQDYSATVDRSYTGTGADGTLQTLTETRLLGTATVDIGEFQPYVGTLATTTTGAYSETSPDFEVEIEGGLSVVGANAQARIEAGSIHIGADDEGNAVHVEAYAFETNPDPQLDESYRNGRHEVRDAADNLIYSSNVAIAQAEFVSTAVSGNEDASQVFEGRVDVSGREAGLRLMAANGGSIRVGDALTEGGTVAGSINVSASGYTIDGNFFYYGHNQFLSDYYGNDRYGISSLYGYYLPPLDAPAVGQLSEGAPTPYLHWGAGRLQVIGGGFDPNSGQYFDQAAGRLTLTGALNVSGVGTATADIWADQVQIDQAVSINAAQGAVYGQLGLAYYYGNSAILLPETIVTGFNQETQTESGYVVIREISGDPEHLVSTTTGRAPVAAATAAYAGISFEGSGNVLLQGPLTVTGLAAEASMEGYDSVTVAGAIVLDGRPEGSAPSYYREDLTYTPYGDNPPSAEPILASSLLIGGRSGMLIDAGVVRLNGGVDIRGTLIAALLLESPDIQITGDLNIDAATGHVESNDPWVVSNPASPVSVDLGLAGLRLGSFQGGAAILHGSLNMTGTTDVQLGGVNLVADGAVQLQASDPNGVVSDFLIDFVEAFEHPFSESDAVNPPLMALAAATEMEPTLDQLLSGGSRSCFVEDGAACSTRIETTGAESDIRLLGQSIETSSLSLVSGADVFAGSLGTESAGVVSLGNLEADGSVRLGISDSIPGTDTASSVTVGNVFAGGVLRIGSLGDITVGNSLQGGSVDLTASGDLHGPQVGNLSIVSTSGDVELAVDQIFLPEGLLSLSAAEELNIQAGQLDLNGFDFHAIDNLVISANSISLTGGDLVGDEVRLTASGTGNQDGLNLTTVNLDGATAVLGGNRINVVESALRGDSLTLTANGGLTVDDSVLGLPTGELVQLGSTAGTITLRHGSLLQSATVRLSSAGSTTVNNASLNAGIGGLIELGSTAGAISIANTSLLRATSIQLTANNGSITVENSILETASQEIVKALTPYPTGSIRLSGRGLTLRNSEVSGGDVSLLGNAGAVILDGGQIEGNIVRIEGSAITAPSAVSIAANGFGARGGILDFELASFTFGTGAAPFGDDGGLFAALPDSAAGLFPSPTTPNASFIATDLLLLGSINGSAQYLLLDTPEVSFHGSIRGASNLFLQIAPGLDDQPRSISDLSFAQFVRTLAIGNAGFSGDIRILDPQQPGGKALIGGADTNYLFLTEGRVTGAENIATNGRVVVVDSTPPPAPEIPDEVAEAPASELVLVSDEFEPSEDEREEEGEAVFDGQPEDDSGDVITDDTGDARQQCDAV